VTDSVVTDQPVWTRGFAAVVAAQMAFGYAISTFLLLPKYLATELHGSASQIGHVGAVPGLTAALIVPFVGGALDRIGRRPLMQIGAVLGTGCALLWLLVDEIGPAAYALQVMSGLAFMLTFSGSSTLVADEAPAAKLGQAIGIFGAANITMNALSPGIAEPLAARFGWSAAFILAAFAFALSFALSFRIEERMRPAPLEHGGSDLAETLGVAARLSPYLIAMLTCGAAFGAVFTFYQPFVIAQGATQVSTFFVGFTLAAVMTRVALGGVADRFGRRRIALIAFVGYALMVLAMTQLTPGLLLFLGFGFGCAHGFFYPALSAFSLEFTQAHERGRAMTLTNGAFHLGNTFSVLCCGWAADSYGYPSAFLLASGIAWLGVGVLVWDTLHRSAPAPALALAASEAWADAPQVASKRC